MRTSTSLVQDSLMSLLHSDNVKSPCRPERSFRTRAPPSRKTGQQREMTWEERFFAEYQPPQLITNKYVLVASIILTVSLAWYSAAARQGGL